MYVVVVMSIQVCSGPVGLTHEHHKPHKHSIKIAIIGLMTPTGTWDVCKGWSDRQIKGKGEQWGRVSVCGRVPGGACF